MTVSPKTLLVLGAQGQVGWELCALEEQTAGPIIGLSRRDVDIRDSRNVRKAIENHRPQIVINAAAYTAVDEAESESDSAYAVNRDGPRNIAVACARLGIPLLHLSTDYVFDGANGKAKSS